MHTREVEEEAEVVWQAEWERKRGSRNRVFYSAAKPLREKVGALWHQRLRFFSPFSYRQSTLRLPNHWQADTLNNQLVKGVEHLATEEPDTAFPSTGGGAQNRAKRRGNVGTFLRGRQKHISKWMMGVCEWGAQRHYMLIQCQLCLHSALHCHQISVLTVLTM